jgi:hypothetical protein
VLSPFMTEFLDATMEFLINWGVISLMLVMVSVTHILMLHECSVMLVHGS